MTPHHKPRNVPLTRIARLSKGTMKDFHFVAASAADKAIAGQHLGFEVAIAALMRLRGY
jgi:hypothetical protein